MFLTFAVLATLLFAFVMFIWSTSGVNILIKLGFFAMTIFGIVIILMLLMPNAQLANGIRLW